MNGTQAANRIHDYTCPTPPCNGRAAGIEVCVLSIPASKYGGGDIYWAHSLDSNRHYVGIADFPGSGISVMGRAERLHGYLDRLLSQGELSGAKYPLEALGDYLRKMDAAAPSFLTAVSLVIGGPKREVSYCNAGHPAPLLFRAAEAEPVLLQEPLSFPIGACFSDKALLERRIKVHRGDSILLITDGLLEALGGNSPKEGFNAIAEIVRRNGEPIASLRKSVTRSLPKTHDDITAVSVSFW